MILSPTGAAIAELVGDTAVAAITTRIRPAEPGENDALGPGNYVPFVIVSVLDEPHQASTATAAATLGLACYGATYALAEALWLACADVFRRKGPRVAASGLGIYNSNVIGGGVYDRDPDTHQPLMRGIVELNTSVQPISV